MLSILAANSGSLLVLIAVYAKLSSSEIGWLGRKLPRFRLRIKHLVILVFVLAVDFWLLRLLSAQKYHQLYATDVAVLVTPLIFGMLRPLTPLELWFIASFLGMLGLLFIPAVSVA